MTLNGGAALNGTRLRLTDGNLSEARSAFFTAPVNVQQFTTGFDFQLTNPRLTALPSLSREDGPTALGAIGRIVSGYRRYYQQHVTVKFDLYNNAGEGPDSTGLYTNGAQPNGSGHQPHSDGHQSAQRRHLQRATGIQRHHADRGDHRHGDQRHGDPDLHRQYPRDRRRHDRLCRIHGRQRRI